MNIANLLKNAQQVQDMMTSAQQELETTEVQGESGAGMVTLITDAKHNVKKLQLQDELLSQPKEIIEDLIIAAFNDASQKITALTQDKVMDASKLFGDLTEGSTAGS